MSLNQNVRVRIAPSPTGDPHVGTAYVALFNYALAKKHGGSFILRIEDTDKERKRPQSESMIFESLKWLGLVPDEGPDNPGKFGPYRQSERLAIYHEHVDILLQKGAAYRCFCTKERLDKLREGQRAEGKKTGYDGHCMSLAKEEVEKRLAEKEPSVVRLKMPKTGTISFKDELRGEVAIEAAQLDDQVLLKTDGYPTYHLANVVDDHLMEISHVIRAEEWISSTPKHVVLYEAFGWQQPLFAHLPLLRNSDKSKISKRKNPVSLSYYKRAGVLAPALVNFLALMGFSYGGDKEVFSLQEMIEVFDLKKISLGDPVFDMTKLTWLNQLYMHRMDEDAFADHLLSQVFTKDYLKRLKPLALERMSRFEQFVDNNNFFFSGALSYDGVNLLPKQKTAKEVKGMLKELAEVLDEVHDWDVETIGETLKAFKEKIGWKPRDFFMTIRLVTTGRKDSPPLNESLELIGRDMVRFRIRDAIGSKALST